MKGRQRGDNKQLNNVFTTHFGTKIGEGSFGLPTHAHTTQIPHHWQNHK